MMNWTQNKIFLAISVLQPEGIPDSEIRGGEGADSPQDYQQYLAWHDVETPWTEQEMEAAHDTAVVRMQTIETRLGVREQIRASWMELAATDPYIFGPFDHKFREVIEHLDAGRDEAAKAVIEYADPPSAYSEAQVARFEEVKAQMLAAIGALPSLT